jgi:hypothetical protein
MDRITDVTPEFASGIGLALLTIFFAVPPLAFLGMYLATRIDRPTPTPSPLPFPDALHPFARFALVLIALHACVVLPFTSFMTLAIFASGDFATNWPLVLFLVVLLLILGTVDANGLRAWTRVFHHAAQTRPASLAN